MPYKDPERKRLWERKHREQRNARRRALRLLSQMHLVSPNSAPDPLPNQQPASGWAVVAGLVVGIGIILIGVLSGIGVKVAGSS